MATWSPDVGVIYQLVRARTQTEVPTTTTYFHRTANVNNWINWAQDIVADRCRFNKKEWTANLVSGTRTYASPDEMLMLTGAQVKDSNGNWQQIELLSWPEHNAIVTNADAEGDDTGTPEYCVFYNDKINFYPKPDYSSTAGIRLRGTAREDAVSSTTNTTFLKGPYIGALVEFVCRESWLKAGDLERAHSCDMRFEREILNIRASKFRENSTRLHRISDVEFGTSYDRDITGWRR